jgi:hypothetical protein
MDAERHRNGKQNNHANGHRVWHSFSDTDGITVGDSNADRHCDEFFHTFSNCESYSNCVTHAKRIGHCE